MRQLRALDPTRFILRREAGKAAITPPHAEDLKPLPVPTGLLPP